MKKDLYERTRNVFVLAIASLFHSQASAMGSPAKHCNVSISQSKIDGWMRDYVPRGANGRSSAAAIYKINKQGYVQHNIFQKNAHTPQAVASTQKMLTAYTAYRLGSLDNRVVWNSDDTIYDVQGGRAILHPSGRRPANGDAMQAKALIKTLITQSSNGAALAISRSGSPQSSRSFMSSLNQYAEELLRGETNFKSYFQNPAGLTDNSSAYRFGDPNKTQLSTADNMARFMGKFGRDEGFKKSMSENGLSYYRNGQLTKAGSTQAAGKTIVVYIPLPRCGEQGVAVALFGESSSTQFNRMNTFLSKLRQELGYSN